MASSTFVSRIQDRLNDPNYNRGIGDDIRVNRRDLEELIRHFRRLDYQVRTQHNKDHPEEHY